MNVIRIVVGDYRCNCYILEKDNNIIVIDPGDEFDKINNYIGKKKLIGIIITHYHFDHIGALEEFKNNYNADVYDISNMTEGENNIGDFKFYIIYTPGHKEDAITIYFKEEKIMFTGDFIFKESVGRCDLSGGNINDMKRSIEKIKNYGDVLIYPGHGDSTNLLYEIENNIYFRYDDIF